MKLCECKCRIYVGFLKFWAPGTPGNHTVYDCTLCLLVLGVELASCYRSGTYIHICIHTYIHTYIHTHIHTSAYIHTYKSMSGLRVLQEFAQKTSNTNVILLEAPIRYDLPLYSCINAEVKLFNKRMRGLMTPFAHIKVMSISTERGHHTRHGLHLANKVKDWIADILVQEIRKAHHLTKANPPIARHWKDVEEDTTQ